MIGLLFDADGNDRAITLDEALAARPGARQLLWLDFDAPPEQVAALARHFDLTDEVARTLAAPGHHPSLERYDSHLMVSVNALAPGHRSDHTGPSSTPLLLVAGQNFVLTRHDRPIGFLEAFRQELRGDTRLGQLDSAAFLAVLLRRHLEGYFAVFAELETQVDRLDEAILGQPASREHLRMLVGLRRQVGELRRHLGHHREVYAALSAPGLSVFSGDEPEAMLGELFNHFEAAETAIGGARDLILGSFDLYMTSTSQRTNDTMRLLTLATVALGIVAAVAGVMGMNFQTSFFRMGNRGFFEVLLGTGALLLLVALLGRWRRWL